MTVRENITICALANVSSRGIIARGRETAAAMSQIKSLSVKTDGPDAMVTTLSGGNQQKCIIGRCMLTNPKVLLLDDPTRGVDIGAKAELYLLMEQLASEGMAIIVTSSELPELLTVSDRILVLNEGVLTGEFSRSEATEQRIMEAATKTQTPDSPRRMDVPVRRPELSGKSTEFSGLAVDFQGDTRHCGTCETRL